jgi:hypothetical protein
MTTAASSAIFRLLGKAGVPSRSEPHSSLLEHIPNQSDTPIWVFGFARTGTTTAQKIIARTLSYNACFEPFAESHAGELGFARAHQLFLGRPTEETWKTYVSPSGVNAALSTFTDTDAGDEKRAVFEAYLDALYKKFGRNAVFKEIRLVGNLDAIQAYHTRRGIPWVCVCIEAHPLSPLYTYYRIGFLCSRGPNAINYPEYVYRYRVATYARLGLYEDIRRVSVSSISDKLVVACLLDQAHMRSFASARPQLCVTTTLGELSGHMETLSERTTGRRTQVNSIPVRRTPRFARDAFFRRAVVEQLSQDVIGALDDAGYSIPPATPTRPSVREAATFLRFLLYE